MSGNEDRKIDALDDYITRKQHGETDGGDALVDRLFELADAIQSKHQPQAMASQRRSGPYDNTTDPQWSDGNMTGAVNRKNGKLHLPKPRRVQFQPGTRTKWAAGMVPFAAVVALLLAFANTMAGVQPAPPAAQRTPTIQAAETISGAQFGDPPVATLNRYRIDSSTLRAGDTLEVSVWWHVREREALDRTIVFVHLIDPAGLLIATSDTKLKEGKAIYQLTVPSESESGSYVLEIGLYNADSTMRLPVVADGQTDGDALILGTITVIGASSGEVPATATALQPPEATPAGTFVITITPTPAPSETPDASPVCYIALDPAIPPGRFVVGTPDPTDTTIIAEIDDGEWVKATGEYAYDQNGNLWLQVEVDGVTGWVMRWYFMFDGRGTDACSVLELVPAAVTPSTPEATPSVEANMPTPMMPTPVPMPDQIETFDYTLSADIGTSAAYTHIIGNGQDDMMHYVDLHVQGIPEGIGIERTVRIVLECAGSRQDLLWGLRGEFYDTNNLVFHWTCGISIDFYVHSGNPDIPLALYLPPGASITYTLTIEIIE